METEFQPNEQSIKHGHSWGRKKVSKLQTFKNKQSFRKPADDRGPRRNSRSASRGRNKAKSGQSPNGKTTQKGQSRSRTRNSQTSRKQQRGVNRNPSPVWANWARIFSPGRIAPGLNLSPLGLGVKFRPTRQRLLLLVFLTIRATEKL